MNARLKTPRRAHAPDDVILDQAIDWMLLLEQTPVEPGDRQRFEAWYASDPACAAVYDQLLRSSEPFRAVRRALGNGTRDLHGVLGQPVDRRGAMARIAAIGLVTTGVGIAVSQTVPFTRLLADESTGTGERRSFRLADGGKATLNACSAIDNAPGNASLRLLAGELMIEAGAPGQHPVQVRTAHAQIEGSGASFSVRLVGNATEVAVQRTGVSIRGLKGGDQRLRAGERLRIDPHGIGTVGTVSAGEFAWLRGFYEVLDRPLVDVIDALRPYRRGYIHVGAGVSELSVTGAFPLDDTWGALSALASALPITVRELSPLLVDVRRRR